MPYLVDLLIGAILTVLALFIIDHGNALRENLASEPQKIINADMASDRLQSSITIMKVEVRENAPRHARGDT
jgi:hypothetical protein